jgi:hypothetical protein
VADASEIESVPRLLFTAPWQPVVVRRGDALGLRALTDEFADAVAPDLSNRVQDGRWVTILAWCLARSQEVFRATGGRSVATRAEQAERYAWLRPLELMWVARTIALAEDWADRSLAGQRRVRPWYEFDRQRTERFGMSVDQFRAYRQTGMYGGYRVAFRKWPGMTVLGDGWTPGKATIRLANWLDARLGRGRPRWALHASDSDESKCPTPNKRSRGKEHEWWLRNWEDFDKGSRSADTDTLPRRRGDFKPLPEPEAALLKALVFGDDRYGKRRLEVVREVGKVPARHHIEVCERLGRAFAGDVTFVMLPRFSRLADAGMKAMDLLATSLQNNARVKLADVAARPKAARICDELIMVAQEWLKNASTQLPHIHSAHRFAIAIPSAPPAEVLRALLEYHESYGGGLRWFVLRNGWVEPRTPWRAGSSRYRFRLWSLCRLATQCGVLRHMPTALLEDIEAEDDENSEATND